jgi:hypothetical protein
MDRRLMLGVGGSLLLSLGVFMPIVSLPLVGGVNYFRNGMGGGTLVLLLALISLTLTLRHRFQWLWTTGMASIALLIGTFIRVNERLLEVKGNMTRNLENNPFAGIAQAAVGSVQIEWGWALLLIGSILLLAAAALRSTTAMLRKCPYCAELIKLEANVCKHCTRDVRPESVPKEMRTPWRIRIVTGLVVIAIMATWINPFLTLLIRAGII